MRRVGRLIVAGMLVTGLAARAHAQMSERGERAVFGGGVGSADQVLAVRSNLGATFHDPSGAIASVSPVQRVVERTWFGHASSQLTYRYTRPFLNIRAAGGGFSYYRPRAERSWSSQYTADAVASTGHTFVISPRSSLSLQQSATFRPSYFGGGDPGSFGTLSSDPTDPSLYLPPEIVSIGGRELAVSSSVSYQHELSRRVSFDATYGLDRTWTFDTDQHFDWLGHRAHAFTRVALTRHLRLRAGYRYMHSRAIGQQDAASFRENTADVGLDFDRGGTLRLSRRTTLALAGGASAFVDSRGNRRYVVLGNATLTHEMGRSWRASAAYRRHVDFSTFFREPVLADTAMADLGGLLTRALSFRAGVSYSKGNVGFVGVNNGLRRAAALAELQAALSRYIALGVNYTYYRHSVGDSVVVRSEFAGRIEGQSVRVYLTAWAPLFHRVRRPDVAR